MLQIDPSNSSATGCLQALHRCAPLKSGWPHEEQWYRAYRPAHSMLPFSSPKSATFDRQTGISFFMTCRPVGTPNFSIMSQGHPSIFCLLISFLPLHVFFPFFIQLCFQHLKTLRASWIIRGQFNELFHFLNSVLQLTLFFPEQTVVIRLCGRIFLTAFKRFMGSLSLLMGFAAR